MILSLGEFPEKLPSIVRRNSTPASTFKNSFLKIISNSLKIQKKDGYHLSILMILHLMTFLVKAGLRRKLIKMVIHVNLLEKV